MDIKKLFWDFCESIKDDFPLQEVWLRFFSDEVLLLEFKYENPQSKNSTPLSSATFTTKTTHIEFFYPQGNKFFPQQVEIKIREFLNRINSLILSAFYETNYENFPLPIFFLDEDKKIKGGNKIAKQKFRKNDIQDIETAILNAKNSKSLPLGFFKFKHRNFYFFLYKFSFIKDFYFMLLIEMDSYLEFISTSLFFQSFYHRLANKVNIITLLSQQLLVQEEDSRKKEHLQVIKNTAADILTFFEPDFQYETKLYPLDFLQELKNILDSLGSTYNNVVFSYDTSNSSASIVKFNSTLLKNIIKKMFEFIISLNLLNKEDNIYFQFKHKNYHHIIVSIRKNVPKLEDILRNNFQANLHYNWLKFLLRKANGKLHITKSKDFTSVYISLPLKTASHKEKVLILMGEKNVLYNIIEEVFMMHNINYEIITSYKDALQKCDFSKYKLILMDIDIPDVDPKIIINLIDKKDGYWILFSSIASEIKKFYPENMTRKYIQKPFRLEELVSIINDYL